MKRNTTYVEDVDATSEVYLGLHNPISKAFLLGGFECSGFLIITAKRSQFNVIWLASLGYIPQLYGVTSPRVPSVPEVRCKKSLPLFHKAAYS